MNRGESSAIKTVETGERAPAENEQPRAKGRYRKQNAGEATAEEASQPLQTQKEGTEERSFVGTTEPPQPKHKSPEHASVGRAVSTFSVLGGGTALIPVPFVDDWLYHKAQRLMVESIFAQDEYSAHKDEIEKLLKRPKSWWLYGPKTVAGAARWFFYKVLLYPARKIVRKVLFFLAMRDGVRRTSQLFHEGYLLHYALQQGHYKPEEQPSTEEIAKLKLAIEETIKEINMAPTRSLITQVLGGSHWLLAQAALRLPFCKPQLPAPVGGQSPLEETTSKREEQQELRLILDQITQALWYDRVHLSALEQAFERQLRIDPSTYPETKQSRYQRLVFAMNG